MEAGTKRRCKADGCTKDLRSESNYCLRRLVCPIHMKMDSVLVDGEPHRFCQQCARFQPLAEFNGVQRSCRETLRRHRQMKKALYAKQSAAKQRKHESKNNVEDNSQSDNSDHQEQVTRQDKDEATPCEGHSDEHVYVGPLAPRPTQLLTALPHAPPDQELPLPFSAERAPLLLAMDCPSKFSCAVQVLGEGSGQFLEFQRASPQVSPGIYALPGVMNLQVLSLQNNMLVPVLVQSANSVLPFQTARNSSIALQTATPLLLTTNSASSLPAQLFGFQGSL